MLNSLATLFGCAWGIVERRVGAAVTYRRAHRELTDMTNVGIHEISGKRGIEDVISV